MTCEKTFETSDKYGDDVKVVQGTKAEIIGTVGSCMLDGHEMNTREIKYTFLQDEDGRVLKVNQNEMKNFKED